MKKYIAPEMTVTKLNSKDGIMTVTSYSINWDEETGTQYVKGESSPSSSSSYNVWDDDWSAE